MGLHQDFFPLPPRNRSKVQNVRYLTHPDLHLLRCKMLPTPVPGSWTLFGSIRFLLCRRNTRCLAWGFTFVFPSTDHSSPQSGKSKVTHADWAVNDLERHVSHSSYGDKGKQNSGMPRESFSAEVACWPSFKEVSDCIKAL